MSKLYEMAVALSAKLDASFGGAFGQAKRTVAGYQKAVNEASKQKLALDRVMNQTRSVQAANQAFIAAQQKVAALARQMAAAKQPSAALRAEYARAQAAVKAASAAYSAQKAKLDQVKAANGANGQSLKQMTARYKELTAAAEKAAKAQRFENAKQRFGNIQSAGRDRAMAGAGQMAAAYGMLKGVQGTLAPGMNLQAQMSQVAANSDFDPKQLQALDDLAVKIGRDTTLSADQAAAGINYMAKQGATYAQIVKAMPQIAAVSEAAGIDDVGQAAEMTTKLVKAYGMSLDDVGKAGDILAAASRKSGTDMASLGDTLASVGPVAQSLGLDFKQTAALASTLTRANVPVEQMQLAMSALLAPTNAQAKALTQMGIKAVDAAGKQKTVEQLLGELSKATAGLGAAQRAQALKQIFGNRAFAAADALMKGMADGTIPDLEKEMGRQGTAARMAAQNNDNLAGDFKSLGSAIDFAKIGIFKGMEPALRTITQALSTAVTTVGNFIQEHQTLAAVIGTTVAVLGGLLGAVGAVNIAVGGAMYIFGGFGKNVLAIAGALKKLKIGTIAYTVASKACAVVMGVMKIAMAALNLVMNLNPIFLIITLIGLLIMAGIALYKHWDDVKAKCSEMWESVKETFTGLWDSVKEIFSGIGDAISEAWESAKAKVTANAIATSQMMTNVWNTIKDVWENVKTSVSNAMDSVWDTVTGVWESVKTTFSDMLKYVTDTFSSLWSSAWQKVTDVFGSIFGTLKDVAKAPINAVIGLINKAIGALNSFGVDLPAALGGGHIGFNIPEIPQLAKGGIISSPTLAMVGEGRDPEAVMPLPKLSELMNIVGDPGSSGGSTVTLNFAPNVTVQGGAQGADQVRSALADASQLMQQEIERYFAQKNRWTYGKGKAYV